MSTLAAEPNPPAATSEPQRRWLALAPGVGNDSIDDALHSAGFRLVNAVPRTDVHFRQRIFARAGGTTYVHDVVDHVNARRYLVLAGSDLDAAASELRDRLPLSDEPAAGSAWPAVVGSGEAP